MDKKQREVHGVNKRPRGTSQRTSGINTRPTEQIQNTISNSKLKNLGDIAETAFQYIATKHGFTVSKPFGENSKYDFITDWNGTLTRVQVKSVCCKKGDVYRVMVVHGKTKEKYDDTQCDVIAAWVNPEDAWYIIPIKDVQARDLNLRPHKVSNGKYEKFKEQWEMLK